MINEVIVYFFWIQKISLSVDVYARGIYIHRVRCPYSKKKEY